MWILSKMSVLAVVKIVKLAHPVKQVVCDSVTDHITSPKSGTQYDSIWHSFLQVSFKYIHIRYTQAI